MNVLMISPYQSASSLGLYAQNMIDYCLLNKNINLTLANLAIQQGSNQIPNKYSKYYAKYDYIIQHCPYDYLSYIPNSKNIWIPIIGNLSHIQDPYINEYVQDIDLICTENKFTEMVIAKSIDQTHKIKKFALEINSQIKKQTNKISFHHHNSAHKYYTVLNYDVDQLCLLNLIKSFAYIFRNHTDHLLAVLLACSPEQYQQIQKLLEELANEARLSQPISNIRIYSTQNISIQDTIPLHHSCDTFLDIEHTAENIHKYFAKLYDSNIIDKIETDYSDSYGYRNHSCFDYKNQVYSMLSDGFDKIFNIAEVQKYNKDPELMEILSEN